MAQLEDTDLCPHCGLVIGEQGARRGECPHCTGDLQNWLCFDCDKENEPQAWPICTSCGLDQEEAAGADDQAEPGPGLAELDGQE